ncbi:MAG: BadF/BadG/BcrA/BcrD ATPase family protein [Candidatus Hadarchaeia archaeon]
MRFLGVDSGAMNTECLVVNSDCEILGYGLSGGGNYHRVGKEAASINIQVCVEEAVSSVDMEEGKLDWGVYGISGLDCDEDFEVYSDMLDFGLCKERTLVNHVVLTHYSVTAGDPGISVMASTGSIVYGVNSDAEDVRIGGWGYLVGDEGSGFYVARRGLQEATKGYDGRREETKLIEAALDYFEIDSFEDVFAQVYGEGGKEKPIAPFSEYVIELASEGDEVAKEIVDESCRELLKAVLAAKEELNLRGNFRVGLSGRLFSFEYFLSEFKREIKSEIPRADIMDSITHPVVGAVALAAGKAGYKLALEDIKELDSKI